MNGKLKTIFDKPDPEKAMDLLITRDKVLDNSISQYDEKYFKTEVYEDLLKSLDLFLSINIAFTTAIGLFEFDLSNNQKLGVVITGIATISLCVLTKNFIIKELTNFYKQMTENSQIEKGEIKNEVEIENLPFKVLSTVITKQKNYNKKLLNSISKL